MKKLFRALGLGWLGWRLFGPESAPRFSGEQHVPLRLPGRTIFVGDRELFVREAGPEYAPPIVLVHGWGDHSLMVWHKIIPVLAERFRVIAFDNRNSGKSDRVREPYEVTQVADEIAAALGEMGVESAAVVGYSFGGMVAQSLAHRHPELVTSLTLGATYAATPHRSPVLRQIAIAVGVAARALDRVSRFELSWGRWIYLMKAGAVDAEHGQWAWTEHMNRDPNLYWHTGRAGLNFDSRAWVGQLRCPTQVIITTNDQLIPVATQYELAALIPQVSVVELADARHEAPLTHNERIAKEIEAFIGG